MESASVCKRNRKVNSTIIEFEDLNKNLHYNPETGIFTRKISRATVKSGDIAGWLSGSGYIYIKVRGYPFRAHRLAWLYVYGYLPEGDIDHINNIKTDNRIANLREVGRSCNRFNIGNQKNSSTGVKGVHYKNDKGYYYWLAHIRINNKLKNLGYYKDFDEAVCARLAAEQCLGRIYCESDSPAGQYVLKNIQMPFVGNPKKF